GRPGEALAAHDRAVALAPNDPDAYFKRGVTLDDLERYPEAESAFRRALALQDSATGHYNLARTLMGQGRLAASEAANRRATEPDREFAEAHCNLGHTLQLQGQPTAAAAAFRRGHELAARRRDWRYPSDLWLREAESQARTEAVLIGAEAGFGGPEADDAIL